MYQLVDKSKSNKENNQQAYQHRITPKEKKRQKYNMITDRK